MCVFPAKIHAPLVLCQSSSPIKDCYFCTFITFKLSIFTLNKYHCKSDYLRDYCGRLGKTSKFRSIPALKKLLRLLLLLIIPCMYLPQSLIFAQLATCCQGRRKEQLSQQQLAEKQSYFLPILIITGLYFPNSVSFLVRNIGSIFLSEHLATLC